MTNRRGGSERTITTLSAVLLAVAFVVVGLVLLGWSAAEGIALAWSTFLAQLGGLLVATGLLTIAWDLWGRRAFATEVLAKAQLGSDVVTSGITRVTDQYLEDVEWHDLFRDTKRLDILVAYANTWRNTHRGRLMEVAGTAGASIRVFLPDPDDDSTVRTLAERFSMDQQDLVMRIRGAIEDFGSLRQPGGASVEVYVRQGDAVFSCYRFDGQAVLTLYSHSRERQTSVPTLVMAGGTLFKFVRDEIDAIAAQSHLAPTGR